MEDVKELADFFGGVGHHFADALVEADFEFVVLDFDGGGVHLACAGSEGAVIQFENEQAFDLGLVQFGG